MSITRLTTCDNIVEASMIKHRLENEGIECYLTNTNFTNLLPGYYGIMGAGIQVMIEENDQEKATQLLGIEADPGLIHCPNCNSEDIRYGLGTNRFKKAFFALLSAIFTIPMSNIRNSCYCNNCKQYFEITN